MLLVTLGWVCVSLYSTLPFIISGSIPDFINAFFESASGYTTTGASILTDIESLPKSILFWRSLTHWLGGMGIVVLMVAVVPLLGVGGVHLVRAEVPGPSLDKLAPKITQTAKIFWLIYLIISAAEVVMLFAGGMTLFDALTHTFGTMATGGFSPKNTSVGYYSSPYIHIVITVFMMMAGVNFILYYKFITGNVKAVLKDTELKVYLVIFIAAALGIALNSRGFYGGFGKSFRFGAFQAASILTTTGFVTADYSSWPAFSQAILFTLMFVGGCSGSTGGGIKVIRILTLFQQGVSTMKNEMHRRGVFPVRISGMAVKQDLINEVAGFVIIYLSLLFVTTMVVASGGFDVLTSFSAALATQGNIGPGFGKVGPVFNYAFLPSYIKGTLIFGMIAGRLELVTVLVLFVPRFWRR
jgi:trk system potassium uptake protein TrkH